MLHNFDLWGIFLYIYIKKTKDLLTEILRKKEGV